MHFKLNMQHILNLGNMKRIFIQNQRMEGKKNSKVNNILSLTIT